MIAPVLGLLGRAGAGKSSVAEYLVETYGARRVSFAGPLKELARRVWEFGHAQLYGPQDVKEAVDPRWGMSPRQALQRLGTHARDVLGVNLWVRAALDTIDRDWETNRHNRPTLYVIDDVRFPNEAEAIASRDDTVRRGWVWKITRPGHATSADPNHPSEAGVDEVGRGWIDSWIVNDGDMAALRALVDDALDGMVLDVRERLFRAAIRSRR